jgi:glycosyltransferase involved in cell wall biosynthesis
MNKVSLVIPTFNQCSYLSACIDHCLFQTYPDIEIIIVDGGSSDGTKEFLNDLQRDIDERMVNPLVIMDGDGRIVRKKQLVFPQNREVRIISFEEDIGATRTYNEGLKRVTGVYCTYIAGDDMIHPHMVEECVNQIEDLDVDFVYTDMNVVDDNGRILRQMRMPDYDFKRCLADWYHLGVSKLYRTELHDRVGLMDEENYKSANDYDQYLRFAIAGARFHHINRILYSVRYHGDDRKTGQHTDERYANLIEESRKCAFRARAHLDSRKDFYGK